MQGLTPENQRRQATQPAPLFAGYEPLSGVIDEYFDPLGQPRREVERLVRLLDSIGHKEFRSRQNLADTAFRRGGITFGVASDAGGAERIFPFDLIPRPIAAGEWRTLEAGLDQRVRALDLFLEDVYGEARILAEGRIPREAVETSKGFRREMVGIRPKSSRRIVIAGIDLVRGADGRFRVLEDNIRTPSGVSYVLENREVMKRIHPVAFDQARVRGVSEYPLRLRDALSSLSSTDPENARIAVLTPGPFNSAYFEHSFLARRMGCELVQGRDLFVHDDAVYVKTTRGPVRLDVIYRRVDDDFLDPEVFRADSLMGVPGLVRAYLAGKVALANAIGNGVADDKGIYPYVPEMIRFYLDSEAILEQVETYRCWEATHRDHVLANLEKMVVKAVDESGGYGMLFGPRAAKAEREAFADKIRANPRGYVAQPVVELSTCPTWASRSLAPRRVDLRPFIVSGRASTWVLPGGLTRVALVEGSYVVNSSQGGGSKDTWVLESASAEASREARRGGPGGEPPPERPDAASGGEARGAEPPWKGAEAMDGRSDE